MGRRGGDADGGGGAASHGVAARRTEAPATGPVLHTIAESQAGPVTDAVHSAAARGRGTMRMGTKPQRFGHNPAPHVGSSPCIPAACWPYDPAAAGISLYGTYAWPFSPRMPGVPPTMPRSALGRYQMRPPSLGCIAIRASAIWAGPALPRGDFLHAARPRHCGLAQSKTRYLATPHETAISMSATVRFLAGASPRADRARADSGTVGTPPRKPRRPYEPGCPPNAMLPQPQRPAPWNRVPASLLR